MTTSYYSKSTTDGEVLIEATAFPRGVQWDDGDTEVAVFHDGRGGAVRVGRDNRGRVAVAWSTSPAPPADALRLGRLITHAAQLAGALEHGTLEAAAAEYEELTESEFVVRLRAAYAAS